MQCSAVYFGVLVLVLVLALHIQMHSSAGAAHKYKILALYSQTPEINYYRLSFIPSAPRGEVDTNVLGEDNNKKPRLITKK